MVRGWISIRRQLRLSPAQIMKVLAAQDVLTVWGDGEQTRSFTYVSDEVDGMMLAVEKASRRRPIKYRHQRGD